MLLLLELALPPLGTYRVLCLPTRSVHRNKVEIRAPASSHVVSQFSMKPKTMKEKQRKKEKVENKFQNSTYIQQV